MIKVLLKYSYHIISFLFMVGLVLIIFIRQYIENELLTMIINYYFWYSFGLFSGAFLAKIVIENYTKKVKKE